MSTADKVRQIDLSGCELIGRGQCADVYKTEEGHAVKIFFETMPYESIIREYEKTCLTKSFGIHSVSCFGLVSWQGKTGIELELVKGTDLQTAMLHDVENSRDYGRRMAEEMKLIHSKTPDKDLFPPIHEFYLDCVGKCLADGWISQEEAGLVESCIRAIPVSDTMIHGDYHTRNIMVEDGELKLIDLADCMSGNPVYDLMITNLYLHFVPAYAPSLFDLFFKITREQLNDCWDQFVRTYFDTCDEARINRINEILNVYSMLKLILAAHSFSNMKEEMLKGIVEMGRTYLMPSIRSYTGVIPEDIRLLGMQEQ